MKKRKRKRRRKIQKLMFEAGQATAFFTYLIVFFNVMPWLVSSDNSALCIIGILYTILSILIFFKLFFNFLRKRELLP